MLVKARYFWLVVAISVPLCFSPALSAGNYGRTLCKQDYFYCIKVKRGASWESLWPDERERRLVKRLNRMNIRLHNGMLIAVPKNLAVINEMDIAPFDQTIEAPGQTLIIVSPKKNAWGAYNASGNLVRWGPASTGQNWCSDIDRGCRTPKGSYHFYNAGGADCISSKFPIPYGGAPMPYCMFFHGGYAIHGSFNVPGYNASHGCVRTLIEDAKWLRYQFIELPKASNNYVGTKIIVESYQ
jgi:L,D-transpeptidase ErfK/SrfK